jgi:transposase
MHPTPSTQCFTAISLLQEGYSLHQVQSKTGLGKSTISRIKKEMGWDKENSKEGCSSKLSPRNKQLIIHQITTGKLNNAVQAANFINNTLPNPVTPQTVRNVLKENNYHSVINKKCPLLSVAVAAGLSWVVYLEK